MRLLSFLPVFFLATVLSAQVECHITGLTATVSPIDPASCQYVVVLNFQHTGTTNQYTVHGNGNNYGTFPYSNVPVTLGPFTAGNAATTREFVVRDAVFEGCSASVVVTIPACSAVTPCSIYDMVVTPGDCVPGSNNYNLTLNFQVTSPTNALFDVFAANGQILGTYALSALPVQINNFPASGNANDVIKVCINDSDNCCKVKEFPAPDCNTTPTCFIDGLMVTTGQCTSNTTYQVTVNFTALYPTAVDSFRVFANGAFLGKFGSNQLPLTIPNFPYNGGANDVIKVCIGNEDLGCCATREFPVPACLNGNPCEITQLVLDPGECHNNGTYNLLVNFDVAGIGVPDSFRVYANNNTFLGSFGTNQLPLTIHNFPWSGGANDVITVCVGNNTAAGGCCRTQQFAAPDCFNPGTPCEVFNLTVQTGECTSNTTYQLHVNFQVESSTPVDSFRVFANGAFFGRYGMNQLPLLIPNFPYNGGANDVIKICIATPLTECCRILEFPVPTCIGGGPCEITQLVVDPGECHDNGTYNLIVNFGVAGISLPDSFRVYANNNTFLGTFGTNQLPLTIHNFPWSGGAHDVITVCVGNNTATGGCCRTLEFAAPDCFDPSGPCEIFNLTVQSGECTSNTTYQLYVNFQLVSATPVDSFIVFANGVFFGRFPMSQLPLMIPNFPYNGGANDVIKICIATAQTECCKTLEFPVPPCLNGNPCHIYDLQVLHTPCLCGQFFAVVNFQFDNVGGGGFDIVGNGHNYGTFEYSHPQPIILGPLPGDGTNYEFVVRDHLHPDCQDVFEMGEVVCMTPVVDPGNTGSMLLSPNPAGDWLQASIQWENGLQAGQSDVRVFSADGRLVLQQIVANGGNFQLNVSNLPAGMYRISVSGEAGRVEGTFAKQ